MKYIPVVPAILFAAMTSAGALCATDLTAKIPMPDSYSARLERVRARMALELKSLPADALKLPEGVEPITVPTTYGANAKQAEGRLRTELKKLRLEMKDVVFADRHAAPPAPGEKTGFAIAAIAMSPVPSRLASCEVAASEVESSLEEQTVEVFSKLRVCLEAKGMTVGSVITSKVYFDQANADAPAKVTLRISAVAAGF